MHVTAKTGDVAENKTTGQESTYFYPYQTPGTRLTQGMTRIEVRVSVLLLVTRVMKRTGGRLTLERISTSTG